MSRTQISVDARKLLVDRVAVSRYIGKSARLRALLLYVCDQVLEHGVREIHEQEVGHAVFGRSANYDTASDNIVRVHASMLRKRLEQYFSSTGSDEPIIIELPKGNYAPLFIERPQIALRSAHETAPAFPVALPAVRSPAPMLLWLLGGLVVVFAALSLVLLIRDGAAAGFSPIRARPPVQGLWSQFFATGPRTDVVLDDEGVALYQELSGRSIALSDYFNRNYLRDLGTGTPSQTVSQGALSAIVIKRQSSFATANLLWRLGAIAAEGRASTSIHFARDYSFRELEVNNAVLLGNTVSNPWIEAFQEHLGLRWKYDAGRGAYYPVDTWAQSSDSETRFRTQGDGYAMAALVPNLSGTGRVLILSSSGGAAMNAAGEFLADNECLQRLKSYLTGSQNEKLPYFEALLRLKSRSRITRDGSIVICRKPRM